MSDLREAILASGLSDGMRISFHHHLRHGDRVVQTVLPVIGELGVRDLTFNVSSVMGPAVAAVTEAIQLGVVTRLETTGMKEPLSAAVSGGALREPVVFRSHGARARAIESGETPVDVAFLAASAVDDGGNANGVGGPNRFGALGYGMLDAAYAHYVIVLSDFPSPGPLSHISLPGEQVDRVVFLDTIGDRAELTGGSLRQSVRPIERVIADRAMEALVATGAIRNGFNFQAGSGGVSLLVANETARYMRERAIVGGFSSGGATGTLVAMVEEGLFSRLYDVQSFDDDAARSLARNDGHLEMTASEYANPNHPDCIAHRLDVMVLSATEVDREFNVNSLTGTDGRIRGALGGAPDTAEGSSLTIVVLPTRRGRIPTLRPRVDTVCTPGEFVDLVCTERGVAVNPRRGDLLQLLTDAKVPIRSLSDEVDAVHRITGRPAAVERGERTVAIVEQRRGGVLDTIKEIK